MEDKALELGDLRGHLLIAFMARRGWRLGTVVGMTKEARYVREKRTVGADGVERVEDELVEKEYGLPGIRREDVGQERISIHAKRGHAQWEYLEEPYMGRARELALGTNAFERLIPWSQNQANRFLVDIARLIGISRPERVHAHLFRHFFATHASRDLGREAWKIQGLMGHKSPSSTAVYIADLTPEEEKEAIQELARKRAERETRIA